jgi:hypothetical protein
MKARMKVVVTLEYLANSIHYEDDDGEEITVDDMAKIDLENYQADPSLLLEDIGEIVNIEVTGEKVE